MSFCTTGTPILHVEASFISAERGLRRGILSRTSLKHHIHFGFILKLAIFICKQLKRPVAFSAVHFDIKPQIVMLQNNFFKLHSSMNISVSKDFGNNRKHVLPLVPEPTVLIKKEDLAQVDLLNDPTDVNSTKVKFAFKILKGGHGEVSREIIQWFVNVERAFTGLNSNNWLLRCQMIQQFACGSAPSGFNSNVLSLATRAGAQLVATTQAEVNRDNGTNAARAQGPTHRSFCSHSSSDK